MPRGSIRPFALLIGSLLILIAGASQGCSPRIKYDLTVENRTTDKLANVRVGLDHTSVGASFGVLVSKGQKGFLLYNTPAREGYLLCYEKTGVAGEWSSWLEFKTDTLPKGWDGDIRLVIEEGVARLQLKPKSGAQSIVAQGPIVSGCPDTREK